jgi:hypothetical protein
MKRATLFNGLLGVLGSLIIVAGALYMYATHIEQPYLYYQNLPFPTEMRVVAGEAVPLSVERCNRTSTAKSYSTTHILTDAATKQPTILPNVQVSIEPGCHRSLSKINVIPADTKPGHYTVSGIATVEGTFGWHRIAWYSEPFEVIAGR